LPPILLCEGNHVEAYAALLAGSAPDRSLVGSTSVPVVRSLALMASSPRAKLLLQSRRASRGEACEVT